MKGYIIVYLCLGLLYASSKLSEKTLSKPWYKCPQAYIFLFFMPFIWLPHLLIEGD